MTVAVLGYRRELLALPHRVYKWCGRLARDRWTRTPRDVKLELTEILIHLPLAYANLRSEVRSCVWATDATPTAAGATCATVPSKVARAIYRVCEQCGGNVRLGARSEMQPDIFKLRPRSQHIDDLRECLGCQYEFRITSHINLQG